MKTTQTRKDMHKMNMVERVAKAIYEADDVWSTAFPWPEMPTSEQSPGNYRRIARAAIEAMKTPTDVMISEGLDSKAWSEGCGSATEMIAGTYTAMITAALNEDGEQQ